MKLALAAIAAAACLLSGCAATTDSWSIKADPQLLSDFARAVVIIAEK